MSKQMLGQIISDDLYAQIHPYAEEKELKIVNENVAAVITERDEHTLAGGSGYWDQIRVFCGSQSAMKEWRWRDPYSTTNDAPELSIHGIGEVEIEQGSKTLITIELLNPRGNRRVGFTFEPPSPAASTLSAEGQASFIEHAEREISTVMKDKKRLWELKEPMIADHPTPTGRMPYRVPCLADKRIEAAWGLAYFIVEEQIGHFGIDREIRRELCVVIGKGPPRLIADEHRYATREGPPILTVTEFTRERIAYQTHSGKKEERIQ